MFLIKLHILIVEQRVELKMQLKELEQFNKKHKEKQKVTR
jgi:hypothetical protein